MWNSVQFIVMVNTIALQTQACAEAMEHTSSDVATYEELSKMEYIDWIMQESMRIYPAAPRYTRSSGL